MHHNGLKTQRTLWSRFFIWNHNFAYIHTLFVLPNYMTHMFQQLLLNLSPKSINCKSKALSAKLSGSILVYTWYWTKIAGNRWLSRKSVVLSAEMSVDWIWKIPEINSETKLVKVTHRVSSALPLIFFFLRLFDYFVIIWVIYCYTWTTVPRYLTKNFFFK